MSFYKPQLKSKYYRKVHFRNAKTEIDSMNLQPLQEVGMESHPNNDQLFMIQDGSGYAEVDGKRVDLMKGALLMVPAGTDHNVVAGPDGLLFYTVYTPPEEPRNVNEWKKSCKALALQLF